MTEKQFLKELKELKELYQELGMYKPFSADHMATLGYNIGQSDASHRLKKLVKQYKKQDK
jgi:hypothetical protein